MVKKSLLLGLVFVSLLLAGCTGQGQISDKPTRSEGEGLQIGGPECLDSDGESVDCSNLHRDKNIRVTLNVKNTGGSPVVIPFKNVIDRARTAEEAAFNALSAGVLKTRCPSIFSAVSSGVSIVKTDNKGLTYRYEKSEDVGQISRGGSVNAQIDRGFFESDRRVALEQGESLDFDWTLKRTDKDPEPGKRFECSLKFDLDTAQGVTAQRKIQILRDRDAKRRSMEAPTSSPSPLVLNLDAPSNWVQTDGEFTAQLFVENQGPGTPQQAIRISDLSSKPSDLLNCEVSSDARNPNVLEYLEDAKSQPRKSFTCTPGNLRVESNIVTLSARADFSYRYDLSDIQVGVDGGAK